MYALQEALAREHQRETLRRSEQARLAEQAAAQRPRHRTVVRRQHRARVARPSA